MVEQLLSDKKVSRNELKIYLRNKLIENMDQFRILERELFT